jgi:hypothetical protein
MAVDGIADLPAVRWRQQNLDKLGEGERAALVAKLEKALAEVGNDDRPTDHRFWLAVAAELNESDQRASADLRPSQP